MTENDLNQSKRWLNKVLNEVPLEDDETQISFILTTSILLNGNDISYDKNLIKAAPKLSVDFVDDDVRHSEPEWQNHIDEIAKGIYPLSQLPNYLQNLAEKLYYQKVSS